MEYSKEDIIRILTENDDDVKPLAIINLNGLENYREANLLLSHLTGQDGRIREAVSFVLSEFEGVEKFYLNESSIKTIVMGILDINPNVVRNIIEFIKKNQNLKREITPFIIEKTNDILIELSKYIKEGAFLENSSKSTKNHAKNKLTFNLYWLLETVSVLDVNKIKNLENILTKTAVFLDYTIREKTALILSKMEKPPLDLLQKLKNDENMYVKNQLL